MAFAKLFETTEFGQVLVKLGENDNGDPEIRFFSEPPSMGVCEFAVTYEASDEGDAKAELILQRIDEEMATQTASMIWANAARLLQPNVTSEN
jgi:hypothetical protein